MRFENTITAMDSNKLVFFIAIFACLTFVCQPANELTFHVMSGIQAQPKNMTVLEGWKNFENAIKEATNMALKMFLPVLMENTTSLNISPQCIRDSIHLLSGVKNIKPWALRFLDSSAKFIDGVLVGTMSSFGAYDECIDTVVKGTRLRDKNKILYVGKYCSVNYAPPLPPKNEFYRFDGILEELKNFSKGGTAVSEAAKYAHLLHFLSPRMGICVPSGCNLDDVNELAKMMGDHVSLNAYAFRCEVKEENEFSPLIIFVITAFSFLGLLMLIGSLIDIYAYYSKIVYKSTTVKVLVAFSLLSNFRKFVNTKSGSDHLECLNGIRFLSLSWIILGHSYIIINYQSFLELERAQNFAKDFAFQAIMNASVAVDTFFFIGGLLVVYLALKAAKANLSFNIVYYIFHRLWRILPVYVFVILFMFLGNLMGSGPIWHECTHKYIQACYDSWWTNLLFINNFYKAENMCIPQSWYIACDFQLYIAAILILLPLLRWPKCGLSLCSLVVVACIVYSGTATYINSFPPTMLFSHPDPGQRASFSAKFYFRPFIHSGPYCIGMLLGYLLSTKPNLKIPFKIQVLGWGLAFISNFSVLYGVFEWNKGAEPTLWEGIIYASFYRVAWTLGVAWMVLCCATGHGGVINYILSWKAFIPLSRLTFVAYLINPLVHIAMIGNIRTNIQPSHFLFVWFYFGHLFVTYAAAFAGSMLVESPTLALEKILLSSKKAKDTVHVPDSVLKGTLTTEKTGNIAVILPSIEEESSDIDKPVIYKL